MSLASNEDSFVIVAMPCLLFAMLCGHKYNYCLKWMPRILIILFKEQNGIMAVGNDEKNLVVKPTVDCKN